VLRRGAVRPAPLKSDARTPKEPAAKGERPFSGHAESTENDRMPIYEYQCEKCEGTFEAIQKFSDDPLTECRLCGDGAVRKLLSAPAFRLKGSGWYETDFKKDRQKNLVKSDGDKGSSSSDAGSSGKSDGGGGAKSDGSSSGGGKSSKASDAA
jgi:putative FmdB family regulatory protein